jgi:hypothetical protein
MAVLLGAIMHHQQTLQMGQHLSFRVVPPLLCRLSWAGQVLGANVNAGQPLPYFGVATYGTQVDILPGNAGALYGADD